MESIFKKFITLIIVFFSVNTLAESESNLAEKVADSLGYAAKYALTEMRPTARFDGISLVKIRQSDRDEGGDIKARVSTYWTTAFTGKSRKMVIDIWLSQDNSNIYLTRYKLYSDDHNIPIMNPIDKKVKVLISLASRSRTDDF